jgi:hypothetical protein
MQFEEGQIVHAAKGKTLPFESAEVSHHGRRAVVVVAPDGHKYMVNPLWLALTRKADA